MVELAPAAWRGVTYLKRSFSFSIGCSNNTQLRRATTTVRIK